MKCHDCGAEVENLGYLKKHKAECPGKSGTLTTPFTVLDATGAASLNVLTRPGSVTETMMNEDTTRDTSSTGFIPYSLCAEELPTLGVGTTVVLQVVGRLTGGGVVVEEAELL